MFWKVKSGQTMRTPASITIMIIPASRGRIDMLASAGLGFNTNLAKSAARLPRFL